MKIGLISDTHDNVENILKAVKEFQKEEVAFVIHLGDVVAPATLKFFKGVKLMLIQGNCDGDIEMMKHNCKDLGFEYLGAFSELKINGKKTFLMHKDPTVDAKERMGKYDFIFHGHTHKRRDETIKGTRIINPGAHYYGTEGTIAVLDCESWKLKSIKVG